MDYLYSCDFIKAICFDVRRMTNNSMQIDNLENYIAKYYTIMAVIIFIISKTTTIKVSFD